MKGNPGYAGGARCRVSRRDGILQADHQAGGVAQASGEVNKYTQDISLPAGGLHAAMIKSSRAHARFTFTRKAASLEALETLLRQQFY